MLKTLLKTKRIIAVTLIIVTVKVIEIQCLSRPFLVKKIFSVAAKHLDNQVNLYGIPMKMNSLKIKTNTLDDYPDKIIFKDDNPEVDQELLSKRVDALKIPILNNGIIDRKHLDEELAVYKKVVDNRKKTPSNCWFHETLEKNRPKVNISPFFRQRNDKRIKLNHVSNSLINTDTFTNNIRRNELETAKGGYLNIYTKSTNDYLLNDLSKLSLDRCLQNPTCLSEMYWWNLLPKRSRHNPQSEGLKLLRRKRQSTALDERLKLRPKSIFELIALKFGERPLQAFDFGHTMRYIVEHISIWFGIPPFYESQAKE